MSEVKAYQEEPLPPRPEPGDCCNGGCAVCVLEGFDEDLARWERECEEIKARNAARRLAMVQPVAAPQG